MIQKEKQNPANALAEQAYYLGKRAASTEFQQGDKDEADRIRAERQKVVDRANKINPNA